jgi:hypothetical protein
MEADAAKPYNPIQAVDRTPIALKPLNLSPHWLHQVVRAEDSHLPLYVVIYAFHELSNYTMTPL